MTLCDHPFEYQGVVTWPDKYSLPGSGAHARNYADMYYCRRCCATKLMNQRQLGNTYEKVRNGAVEYTEEPK